ncbi:MAG: hypothetical protein RLZZ490_1534, partial [Cyanobacteriota bacterium]
MILPSRVIFTLAGIVAFNTLTLPPASANSIPIKPSVEIAQTSTQTNLAL